MKKYALALVPAGLLILGAVMVPKMADAQLTGNIVLKGTVAQNCSVVVSATAGASTLDLSTGTRRVQVGTAVQNCNKKAGYTLDVSSANCATGTVGAKLIGASGAEQMRYSGEFNNPTTGGSTATVTGLLGTSCSTTAQIRGRDVTNAKITNETTNIFVNYTGDSALGADTYTDTFTITMTVK